MEEFEKKLVDPLGPTPGGPAAIPYPLTAIPSPPTAIPYQSLSEFVMKLDTWYAYSWGCVRMCSQWPESDHLCPDT